MAGVQEQDTGDAMCDMQQPIGSTTDGAFPTEGGLTAPHKGALAVPSFFAPRKRPAQLQPSAGGKPAGGGVHQGHKAGQQGFQSPSKQQQQEEKLTTTTGVIIGATPPPEGAGATQVSPPARPGRMLGALHGGGGGPHSCDVGDLFTREAMGLPLAQYDPVSE